MKAKIAITGLPKTNKTLLALTLAKMTDMPFIQNKTMYDWFRIYNLPESNLKWKDKFLIAASSFLERTAVEEAFDQFVSDGATFSELMWLKINTAKHIQNNIQRERERIVESLEKTSLTFAAQQYDFIIHAAAPSNNDRASNDLFLQMYTRYHIPYKEYNTDVLEQALEEILDDLNFPTENHIEYFIDQAKSVLFFKN